MEITIGRQGHASATVSREMTAKIVGSGSLLVLATPYLAALMEAAACDCLAQCLEPGQTSVGTQLAITHDAATPVGMDISATATITAVDGRKITFSVAAADERGAIGSGTHMRVLVKEEPFLQKVYGKL